jgi:hypothetical protein
MSNPRKTKVKPLNKLGGSNAEKKSNETAAKQDAEQAAELTRIYLKQTVILAEHLGDTDSANHLIDHALGAFETGMPLDAEVGKFFIRAFREILNGTPAQDALMLCGKKGRKSDQNVERDVSLAACVIHLMQKRRLTKAKACNFAAENYGSRWSLTPDSWKTFERAYNVFAVGLKKLDPDTLLQLAFAKTPVRHRV